MEKEVQDLYDMCDNGDIEDSLNKLMEEGEIEKDVFDFFNDIILKKRREDQDVTIVPKAVKRVSFADPLVEFETLTIDNTNE